MLKLLCGTRAHTHTRSLTPPFLWSGASRLQRAGLFDVSQSVQYSTAWNGSQFLPLNQLHSLSSACISPLTVTAASDSKHTSTPPLFYQPHLLPPAPQPRNAWTQVISCTLFSTLNLYFSNFSETHYRYQFKNFEFPKWIQLSAACRMFVLTPAKKKALSSPHQVFCSKWAIIISWDVVCGLID